MVRRILAIIFQAAPTEIIILICLSIIIGAGPSLSLFFSKVTIDELTRLLGSNNVDTLAKLLSQPKLLSSVAAMSIINLLVDALRPVDNIIFPTLKDGVKGFIKSQLISKVARFNDLALFETPQLLSLLELAERRVEDIPELIYLITDGLSGICILVPAILLAGIISWWVPILLILLSIPSRIINTIYVKKSWRLEETQADLVRQMDLFANLLLDRTFAKEVRLFSLEYLLITEWQTLYSRSYTSMKSLRWRGASIAFFCALVEGTGTIVPYLYLTLGAIGGSYSIGDLALYTGAIFQLRIGMQILLGAGNNIYRVVLSIQPIFEFLSIEPKIEDGDRALNSIDLIAATERGIKIQALTFTYPESDRPTLHDIELHIHPGETIAIVGENGSGKTTLSKLLCRLYDPDCGQILWNGCNLKSIYLTDLRSAIAVVMQDYSRFPVTLRENVGWGCLAKLADDRAIRDVLEMVGLTSIIDSSDRGLDLLLCKQFADGIDLSAGQWQRLAIARALLRYPQSQLLIFDELTAAIDPIEEYEIYQILQQITQERMSVIIGHRLGLAKLADRIIVMESGQIIEEGSHDRLMDLGGLYHHMFVRQMSYYVDPA